MALINVDEKKKREEFPEVDANSVVAQGNSKIDITSKDNGFFAWLLDHKIIIFCGVLVIALVILTVAGVKFLESHIVPDDHEHVYVNHLCTLCNKEETYDITYHDDSGDYTVSYSYFTEIITKPKLTQRLGYVASWGEVVDSETGEKKVEAIYTIIEFNINYHISTEGIENNTNNPTTYTVNDTINLEPLDVNGYYFSGWYSDQDYKNKITTIDVGTTGDIEIYGKIDANQTIISFNLNGGSGNVGNVSIPALGTYVFEDVDVSKRTYKFLGWSLKKDEEVKYYVGDAITASSANAKMTLYAVWQKNKTIITFDANGGEGEKTTQTFVCFVPTDLMKVKFEKNAATLIGWSTEKNGDLVYKVNDQFTAGEEETELTLYAKWKTNTNSIIFDRNGGIGQMADINVESLTSIALPLCEYTNEGSKFIGWSTTKDGSVEYKDQSIYLANADDADVTLYAIWAVNDEITIHFNNNDGVGYAADIKVELLTTVGLPTSGFTKPGLTFAGWALSSLGEIAYVDTYTYNTRILGSEITLYAVYDENRTIIRYNANGGTGTMDNQEIAAGKNANLIANTFTNPGYKFLGWSYTKDGNVDIYDKAYYEAPLKLITLELYAVWERNITTIVFVKNGSIGAMLNQTVESNTQVFLQENKFTKDVNYFMGWALEPTGEVVYKDKALFTAGNDTEYVYLYAKFKTNRTVFHYNANGGIGESYDSEIPYSTMGNISNCTFTYKNYSFIGWCTDPVYEGQELFTANQEYSAGVEYKEITLYAIWKKNKTTINFYSKYTDTQMETIEAVAGETITLPTNTYTRTGYSFIGWSINTDGITAYSDGAEFTGYSENTVITLIPTWEINKVILTFNPNGGTGYMSPVNLNAFQRTQMPECGFSRENMHFIGWGVGTREDVNYEENEEYITPADVGEIIAYAIWEENIQEVSLIYNDGEVHEVKVSLNVVNGDTITLIPTKENYEFLGWSQYSTSTTAQFASNEFIVIGVSDEYKLYAVFREYVGSLGIVYEGIYEGSNLVGYAVSDYQGEDTNVIIPGVYNSKPVKEIKANAFKNNTDIASVKLVNNITKIGESAFYGCSNLTTIDLGNKLITIGESAFEETSLISISLPNTVTTVGKKAFASNSCMEEFVFSTSMTTISESMFEENSIKTIVIPSNIKTIENKAFYYAVALETVEFNEGLETIGQYSFAHASTLTTVSFPNSLKSIGKYAFEYAANIERPRFGTELQRIEAYAFAYIDDLKEVTIPFNCTFLGEGVFANTNFETLVINGQIEYVNKNSFINNTTLENVTLPSTVRILFASAFEGCHLLTKIVLPSTLSAIYDNAFKNTSVNTIYYMSTETNWNDITLGTDALSTGVNVYYYSELEPEDNVESYWHYVNGNPRRWTL